MLIAHQLQLHTPTRRPLINALDWTLKPGECWAILAPNGTGKSTLLQTLAGLRQPQGGTITHHGDDIHALAPRIRAQHIGWLAQDTPLRIALPVEEFVALGGYARSPRLTDIDPHQLDAILAQWSLTEIRQQRLDTLSGGERQRAALAQLTLQNPDIWLLDEPAQHLDVAHQANMMEILRDIAQQQRTVVAVLHDINLALRYCTHALLLLAPNRIIGGPTATTLTREQLSELYRHPLRQFDVDGQVGFLPG